MKAMLLGSACLLIGTSVFGKVIKDENKKEDLKKKTLLETGNYEKTPVDLIVFPNAHQTIITFEQHLVTP